MPRHQYSAEEVAHRVLYCELLFKICEVVFSKKEIVHASEVAKVLGINIGYAYKLLRKLEKWGVLRGVKDPVNGKLAFKPSNRKVAQIIAEEIKKRRAEEISDMILSDIIEK